MQHSKIIRSSVFRPHQLKDILISFDMLSVQDGHRTAIDRNALLSTYVSCYSVRTH